MWQNNSRAILQQNTEDRTVDRHDCVTMDVNKDGEIDIVCLVGAHKGRGLGLNELCEFTPFLLRLGTLGRTEALEAMIILNSAYLCSIFSSL